MISTPEKHLQQDADTLDFLLFAIQSQGQLMHVYTNENMKV